MIITNSNKTILKGGALGNLVSHLFTINSAKHIPIDNPKLMCFETTEEAIISYCEDMTALGNEVAVGVPFTFWNVWEGAYSEIAATNNAEVTVTKMEVFIYAPIAILSAQVPDGLPNRLQEDGVTVNTFAEWLATWNGRLFQSVDDIKVLLTTTANNSYLTLEEVKVLFDYCAANNYELCNKPRYTLLIGSLEFTS